MWALMDGKADGRPGSGNTGCGMHNPLYCLPSKPFGGSRIHLDQSHDSRTGKCWRVHSANTHIGTEENERRVDFKEKEQ